MRLTARLLAVSVALTGASTTGACSPPVTHHQSAPTPKIYTYTSDANGFNTQTHFLDTGKSVVAFDAQFTPSYGEKALAYLRSKSSHPVKYLVVTHPNPDKFQGISAFKAAGATSIASTGTANAMRSVWKYKKTYFVNIAKTFTEATYPRLPAIDKTFDGHRTLIVDDVRIDLTVLAKPGISSTQTVATIPALKSVLVGDLIHHDAHSWLEGGIVNGKPTPRIEGWKQDLDQIGQLAGKKWTVYGGRGSVTSVATAVSQQKTYLNTADKDASALVQSLTVAQRKAAVADPSPLVAQLTRKLTAQFPTYTLPYMIDYGAYGLINQHLAA
ncbi:MBL fold metallo-hydrolase [Streptomyces sp. NPDC059688]|uniref:MBL fold metallo-hydrolase n=1 Tax=Streptomyces sp. NPDC059688 TaxID=3346906 RepID=UPI0036C59A3D